MLWSLRCLRWVPLLGEDLFLLAIARVQDELLSFQHGVFDLCGKDDLCQRLLEGLEPEVALVLLLLLFAWPLDVLLF